MRGTTPAVAAALLSVAVLLSGCDQGDAAASCEVDVDTAELRDDRARAGIEACPDGDGSGDTDLPAVLLPCLGGGADAALADIEGPAVINFWASWCGPCRKEMPAIQQFHEQHGDEVSVVGVDWVDTYPGAAIDLARQTGATYPSYADPCGALQETDLAITALPVFVFVREDGSTGPPVARGGIDEVAEVVELAEEHLDVELSGSSR